MKKLLCILCSFLLLTAAVIPVLAEGITSGETSVTDPASFDTPQGRMTQIIIISVIAAVSLAILAVVIICETKRSK